MEISSPPLNRIFHGSPGRGLDLSFDLWSSWLYVVLIILGLGLLSWSVLIFVFESGSWLFSVVAWS